MKRKFGACVHIGKWNDGMVRIEITERGKNGGMMCEVKLTPKEFTDAIYSSGRGEGTHWTARPEESEGA